MCSIWLCESINKLNEYTLADEFLMRFRFDLDFLFLVVIVVLSFFFCIFCAFSEKRAKNELLPSQNEMRASTSAFAGKQKISWVPQNSTPCVSYTPCVHSLKMSTQLTRTWVAPETERERERAHQYKQRCLQFALLSISIWLWVQHVCLPFFWSFYQKQRDKVKESIVLRERSYQLLKEMCVARYLEFFDILTFY